MIDGNNARPSGVSLITKRPLLGANGFNFGIHPLNRLFGLTDGRVIVGKFVCLDKQRNILLVEAQESRLVRGVVDLMSAPCRPAQTPLDSTH